MSDAPEIHDAGEPDVDHDVLADGIPEDSGPEPDLNEPGVDTEPIVEVEDGPDLSTLHGRLSALTIAELREHAAQAGIELPSRASHSKLVDIVETASLPPADAVPVVNSDDFHPGE